MTAAELNATLAELGWSQRELSRRLGADKMLVNKWATGKLPIPQMIAWWLTRVRVSLAKVPEPDWLRESQRNY